MKTTAPVSTRQGADHAPTPTSAKLMRRAVEVNQVLVDGGADAVAVFGSTARGTAAPTSDLDMFVVWPLPVSIRKSIGRDKLSDIGLSVANWERLQDHEGAQWSFFRTIRDELIILHDPDQRLQKTLAALPERPEREYLRQTSARLRGLTDLDKAIWKLQLLSEEYQDIHEACYRWSKVGAVEANICRGMMLAGREDNLRALGERHPELDDHLAWIEQIKGSYLLSMGKSGEVSTFDDQVEAAERSLQAMNRIMCAACDELDQQAQG